MNEKIRFTRVIKLVVFSCLLISCCAPNKCLQAKIGFSELEPIINKIEAHRERTGMLPDSLNELDQFSEKDLELDLVKKCPTCKAVRYYKDGERYRIEFGYFKPGNNHCIYSSETKKWNCTGNF